MMRSAVLAVSALAIAASLGAQQPYGSGPYDPAVPTPKSVLGYEVGDQFTPHHMLSRYIDRVAATSRRVKVDTVAWTFEGREVYLIAVSSEANIARLEQVRADAARLADPRGASQGDLNAAVARLPAVIWLGFSVHGGEASGVEASIALLYQLAAGRDAETQMILDSVVTLIDPVENPDGHERHVQDVRRNRGLNQPTSPAAMIQGGNWPGPRTSHYYFDLNRDWFIMSHPETRGRIATFLKWWPLAAVDLHEQGSSSTYYFAPPMGPVNANVPENIRHWWDIYAQGNIAAFDQHGWSYFRREAYDEFYPGYGDSWPILVGSVGMTYEQASSSGGAIRRDDGTTMTLHDAAFHHYTAAWSTLRTSAQRARERVRDFLAFRQAAIADGARAPVRSVVIERDAQGRGDSLAARLMDNGIEVGRLRAQADVGNATMYGESASATARVPAGSYVVDMSQPMGVLAKALLEADARLDSSFIKEEIEHRRTGQSDRFYDITGWSLPLAFRARAWGARALPGATDPVTRADFARTAHPAAPAQGRYGYAFKPGSDASIRLLSGLLTDSVRVWWAPHAFTQGGASFPQGAFVVRVAMNDAAVYDVVRRRAEEAGAEVVPLNSASADSGTDLGSNSVIPVIRPRIAMLGGAPIGGNSFGFAWYAFDQRLDYPVTSLTVQAASGGALADFNVLVIPSVGPGALDGALGEGGRTRLAEWVRAGGTLITLDAATQWLAAERTGLARFRLRRDSMRADSTGGAALPSSVPGAIVRGYGDTLSTLMAGIRGDIPLLVNGDRVYNVPKDLSAGEAVVRMAALPRLRLAGYLWPEMPARLAESVYLWTESVGRGRVIGFAGDPNFRDHFRGLLPLFANAVLLGPSM